MKGTRRKKAKRGPRLAYLPATEGEFVQRKLTLPSDLDNFLTAFARQKGVSSNVQATYLILREAMAEFEAATT